MLNNSAITAVTIREAVLLQILTYAVMEKEMKTKGKLW